MDTVASTAPSSTTVRDSMASLRCHGLFCDQKVACIAGYTISCVTAAFRFHMTEMADMPLGGGASRPCAAAEHAVGCHQFSLPVKLKPLCSATTVQLLLYLLSPGPTVLPLAQPLYHI